MVAPLEALETAQAADKMVVLLKAGRTKAGGEAALTHTGAVAGSDVVQDHSGVHLGS